MKLLVATTICAFSLLAAPFARAGGECLRNSADCHNPTSGSTDPLTVKTGGQESNSGSTRKQENPPPASGAAAAQGYASSVTTMTGTTYDSQGQVQKQHGSMTSSGSSASRETGTMDLLEAILILPFNPGRAAKLLLSGEQAHQAAAGLDTVTAKANKNNELMQGTPNLGTAANANGQGTNGGQNGQAGNASGASSNAPASARAGELYGQLEDKYGMGRSDFDNEANRVKGDPEALATFMQEATGDKAIGKDAVNSALDAYALELGLTRAELRTSHLPAATEFAVSAPPSGPSAPAAINAPSAPKADTEAERKLASAKEKEKKESLRDKLKKALAERQGGRPSEETFEKLEPIKDQFFDKLKAEQEKELSLFEVVRAKYLEKREMLERAPGAPTQ